MSKRLKKIVFGISGLIIVFAIGIFVLNYYIKNKIENEIAGLSDKFKIEYKDIDVNALGGTLSFVNPLVSVYGETNQEINLQAELERFTIEDVSFWDYLFNDRIAVENIIFNKPNVTYYHNDLVKSKSYKNGLKNVSNKKINIKSIQINNGAVKIYDVATDSIMLQSKKIDFRISAVLINQKNKKVPFSYKDFNFSTRNLYYSLNAFDNLFLEQLTANSSSTKLKGFAIKTKYKKEVLSKMLSKERDYFDLTVDSMVVKHQDFGFQQDSIFYFKSKRVDFYNPHFDIYRDKLVTDDVTYKPLYSNMLRGLKFNLTLNEVFLNNAKIVYTEKVKEDTDGGKLEFSNFNAEIKNLSNTYKAKDTVTAIHVNAIFMKNTPLHVVWDFDVNNTTDAFLYKGELGNLEANAMNQFMEPNLNVRLKGIINKTYFTISGNDSISQVDLKLKYDDFDVVVLKQNGKEKNKFLSSLVNLIVSKDSKKKSNSFRFGSKTGVERDKTKSVFNYQWLNIKAGLLNAMTGNGKKNKNN